MTDKKEAIRIAKVFLNKKEGYQNYRVDDANILERDSLWYIPFKQRIPKSNEVSVGAYNGIIVDKNSSDFLQPGSALPLEEWMYGFEIGIRGKRYDLIIEKVSDLQKALDVLSSMGLTYIDIEVEHGIEWKIPKNFTRKEIQKRLNKLPCTFKNQTFSYEIGKFKTIRNERIFEYKLEITTQS